MKHLFLLIVLTMVSSDLIACDCARYDLENVIDNYDLVFQGKVNSIYTKSIWSKNQHVTSTVNEVNFAVSKVYKSQTGAEVLVYTDPRSGMCGYHFKVNQDYIVFAISGRKEREVKFGWPDSEPVVSSCSPTIDIERIKEYNEKKLDSTIDFLNSLDVRDANRIRIAEARHLASVVLEKGESNSASGKACNVCPEMVVIAGGSFIMGDLNGGGGDNESPIHLVDIETFALGKTEVTFAEFDAFARATNRSLPKDEGWQGNRPVINVSWNDAKSYVKWLSNKAGEQFRLPSESEWEYSARAGSRTKYSWGNSPSGEHANGEQAGNWPASIKKKEPIGWPYDGFDRMTAPVAHFQANAFGLNDMHGNVIEWVEDCYTNTYLGAPSNGSARTNGRCRYRVLRGGSWDTYPMGLRSASRGLGEPNERNNGAGFRVAQDL